MSIFTFNTKNVPLDQFAEHDPADGLYEGTYDGDTFYTFIDGKPVKWKLSIPYRGKNDFRCLVEESGSYRVLGYPSVDRFGKPIFCTVE